MLNIKIISVGKLKEKYLKDCQSEYIKRLTAFSKTEIIEIDEYKCSSNPSYAEIEKVIFMEGEKIAAKIPSGSFVFSMCIEGEIISSEKLASKINLLTNNFSTICFIIGGSFGLSDKIKNLSHFKLSLSLMTFPHQLLRVILLEQIYRCFQINSGGKYHK